MSKKRRLKARVTAMEDPLAAELRSLVALSNGIINWVRVGMVLQSELGKAIERVGEQQRQLQAVADESERGY